MSKAIERAERAHACGECFHMISFDLFFPRQKSVPCEIPPAISIASIRLNKPKVISCPYFPFSAAYETQTKST